MPLPMLGYEGVKEPQVGIEPTTVRLQGGCSAELSFKGQLRRSAIRGEGLEPPSSSL